MRLKNKKTGEIVEFRYLQSDHVAPLVLTTYENDKPEMYSYTSLAELNEEWEDYEEQKGNWTIDPMNENYIDDGRYTAPDELERYEELGLKFNTREEAEKAVDKLKAFKRLKDKGFRFKLSPAVGSLDINPDKFQIEVNADMPAKWFTCDAVQKDLEACFGGVE